MQYLIICRIHGHLLSKGMRLLAIDMSVTNVHKAYIKEGGLLALYGYDIDISVQHD